MGSLQSLDFSVTGSLNGTAQLPLHIDVSADGTVQDGGEQMQATMKADGSLPKGGIAHDIHLDADVVSQWSEWLFLRVRRAQSAPALPGWRMDLFSSAHGGWMKIPLGSGSPVAMDVTPDPGLLRAQFAVLRVTNDLGTETLDGSATYHYEVAIDRPKLLEFMRQSAAANGEMFDAGREDAQLQAWRVSGEVWIDSRYYYLRRFIWRLQPDARCCALSFDVRLQNHNAAHPVTFPRDAVIEPPNFLQALTGSSSLLPFDFPKAEGSMDSESNASASDSQLIEQLYNRQKAAEKSNASSPSASASPPSS